MGGLYERPCGASGSSAGRKGIRLCKPTPTPDQDLHAQFKRSDVREGIRQDTLARPFQRKVWELYESEFEV